MKLSKLAIGLAAVVAFSGSAFAGGGNLGALSVPSNTFFADNLVKGAFTDIFTFSVPNSLADSSLTSIKLGSSSITGLNFSLYQGATLVEAGISSTTNGVTSAYLNPAYLSAGNYSLDVTGTGSTKGGSYTGMLSVAAPVPEPTEGALLLSGLGLMGFIATRRRNQA